MFKEFAIEPSVLSSQENLRYFCEKFGWEKGVLVSEFPRAWYKMIHDSISDSSARKVAEVKLFSMKQKSIKRQVTNFSDSAQWINKVTNENAVNPFHRVVTSGTNPSGKDNFIQADSVEELDWKTSSGLTERSPEAYTTLLKLLLQTSTELLYIDPFFDATEARFMSTLNAFINTTLTSQYRRRKCTLEIHTTTRAETQHAAQTKINNLRSNFSIDLPESFSLTMFVWKQKSQGENFHNRYLLSENAGVSFGIGLDIDSNQTDDLSRLDVEQHEYRYSLFAENDQGNRSDVYELLASELIC